MNTPTQICTFLLKCQLCIIFTGSRYPALCSSKTYRCLDVAVGVRERWEVRRNVGWAWLFGARLQRLGSWRHPVLHGCNGTYLSQGNLNGTNPTLPLGPVSNIVPLTREGSNVRGGGEGRTVTRQSGKTGPFEEGAIMLGQFKKVHSPNLLKRKCISGVARICIIIIFHLSKL